MNNSVLENVLSYQTKDNLELVVRDALIEDTESRMIPKGIATFEYGATDLQVNGDLFIADTDRQNPVNVLDALRINDIYSTTEVPIGVWIDGRTIYRQVQYLGDISGANTSGWAINGMVGLVNLWGVGFSSTYNQWYNFPNVHSTFENYYVALLLVNTNTPQVRLGTTLQSQGLKYVAIVIEYTK